jgi:hypothetical protein
MHQRSAQLRELFSKMRLAASISWWAVHPVRDGGSARARRRVR